nr:MAG TPA: hypothetical protein [Bacteriophage sp.]
MLKFWFLPPPVIPKTTVKQYFTLYYSILVGYKGIKKIASNFYMVITGK